MLKARSRSVHRCRFAEYKPSMIMSISVSAAGDYMAVGRENGSIEIWSISGKQWFAERILVGKDSLRSVLWVHSSGEDRLFSASLSGTIHEWDLSTSRIKQSTDSYGGPVWSIAVDASGNQIAAACDDGLRLFDISYGIQLKKSFNKVGKGRYLSVAWSKAGDLIYTGDSSGYVRQWTVQSASNTVSLRLAKVSRTCNVWTLSVLPDGSVVAGDSRGVIGVWDPVTTTQIFSVKTHDADVLAMATLVTEKQIAIVASGPDSTMVCLQRVESEEKGYQWVQGGRFRHHSRDVLAVAITPKQTIASGGLAGDVHGLPLKSLIQTDKHPNCKKYPPFSPRALVSFSEAKRRFLFRRSDEMMEVWRAGTEVEGSRASVTANKPGEQGAQLQIADMPAIQARLVVKAGEKIVDCKLSSDGEAIACADTSGLKIFRLEQQEKEQRVLRVRKQEVQGVSDPIAWVLWVSDELLAVGGLNGGVHLIDVVAAPTVVASISPDWTRVSHAWTGVVAASSDGQWVAAGRPGGNVDIFRITKVGDQVQLKLHGALPSPDEAGAGVTALAFKPNSDDLVAARVGVASQGSSAGAELLAYNLDKMALSSWARKPIRLETKQAITGISFVPSEDNKILLSAPYMLSLLTLADGDRNPAQKKFDDYGWVLFSSFGDNGESLFIVERTQEAIYGSMPPPIMHRRKYAKG